MNDPRARVSPHARSRLVILPAHDPGAARRLAEATDTSTPESVLAGEIQRSPEETS
jgi:hypothetical protein